MLNIFCKKINVYLLILVSLIVSTNMALTNDFTKEKTEINHPIIIKPFKGAKSAAGYFTIKNHGPMTISLKAISMTLAKATLHQTKTDADGIVRMNHVKKVDIPARGELVLKPGSFHIMIAGINRPLLLDEKIPAILIFENDFEIKIVFTVTDTAKRISSKDKKKHSH